MKKNLPRNLGHSVALAITAAVMSFGIGPNPFAATAHACAFDLTKPESTAIDWIIKAEALVLARPDPENPFSYKVVKVLRGEENNYDLPFLVHSLYRTTLTQNPEDTVLFRKTTNDSWAQVAYVDPDFNDVLDTTLANLEPWKDDYPISRFAIFEALQTSTNPRLRELAIRELDKAPYKMLRTLDLQFATEDLLANLWTPVGYPFQPIRVLLLGLSNDDRARKEIYGYFTRNQDRDWANNIGAFTAALIELDGIAGVEFLDRTLLSDQRQPLDKLEGVISALAVQRGAAPQDVRQTIDQVLARLVEARPQLAPVVAQQFSTFSDWSQAAPLEKLVRERRLLTTTDLMMVSVYVAQARGSAKSKSTAPEKG